MVVKRTLQENTREQRGEWSIRDPIAGHRLCNYHNHGKNLPHNTHLHNPQNQTIASIQQSHKDAQQLMKKYAEKYDHFEKTKFLKLCKSPYTEL